MAANKSDFHKAQRRLNSVIEEISKMRLEACETEQCEARDNLGEVLGYLYLANAAGGKVRMLDKGGDMIEPRGGGK